MEVYGAGNSPKPNTLSRIAKYIPIQLRITYLILRTSGKVDLWIFFTGGLGSPLPILIGKLFGKKTLLIYPGSDVEILRAQSKILPKPMELLTRASSIISDRIIVYSQTLISQYNLQKYSHKISIANEYFIDIDKFKITTDFDKRENLVAYIGRLSQEKGALNFVSAIPKILQERDDIKFLVGGDGPLRNKIAKFVYEKRLKDKIKLTGWIPHNELPDYLNKLKLIVLPSYTEGIPAIMLEAMACGTPVLITPVGPIPDVIKHGETGLIMEKNTPVSIALNILEAMICQGLSKIAQNARKLIEQEYTYEDTVEQYKIALDKLMKM
jgi:glycosyltransferase involved in cell wall biosynthesis